MKPNTQQYTSAPDKTPLISPKEMKYIKSGVRAFLSYARALESTVLPGLNNIGLNQAQPTEGTKEELQQCMDYAATYLNAVLRFYTSNMILKIDSDAV